MNKGWRWIPKHKLGAEELRVAKLRAVGALASIHEAARAIEETCKGAKPVSHWDGRALIYVSIDRIHFTTDAAWSEYMRIRKERPAIVLLYGTIEELKAKLLEERRIIVCL